MPRFKAHPRPRFKLHELAHHAANLLHHLTHLRGR